jgi:hypothetical protein
MDNWGRAIRKSLARGVTAATASLLAVTAAAQEVGTFPQAPELFYQPRTLSGWLWTSRWELLAGAAVLAVHAIAAWLVVRVVRRRSSRRRLVPVDLGRRKRARQRRRPNTGALPVVPKQTN